MIEPLYFDENMPHRMEDILRGMACEVHTVDEMNSRSEDNSTPLRLSTEKGCVLITQDRKDFRRMHWLWTPCISGGAARRAQRHPNDIPAQ